MGGGTERLSINRPFFSFLQFLQAPGSIFPRKLVFCAFHNLLNPTPFLFFSKMTKFSQIFENFKIFKKNVFPASTGVHNHTSHIPMTTYIQGQNRPYFHVKMHCKQIACKIMQHCMKIMSGLVKKCENLSIFFVSHSPIFGRKNRYRLK